MRRNIQRLLSVLMLAITLICPLKGWAQESSIQDTVSIEKHSDHKWYNYLWQHLQFTKNIGYNMYGDNVVNSYINRLGRNDRSYAMNGFKFSFEIKYNVFECNHWNLYTGVGCALYSQNFKSDYVYFKDNGSVGTFIHTNNPGYIANTESKQPMDFGLDHNDWNSSFSTMYITFPIGVSYAASKLEYGFTVLPSVRVGNTYLRRDISIGVGEDMETLYESKDESLDRYINNFGCQLRFSCLYKGIIGGYVEFGTMSMTNNLKHDIYSFSIGVQVQLTPKNL
ncbi:MAG: hypothetical protein UD961_14185 [Bacteroidales bacterium]|nr:hypothetical protein [Bacteroidales bacterium]